MSEHSQEGVEREPTTPRDANPVDQVRRRFLLAGAIYTAPAVLASFALGEEAYGACPPYVNNCDPFRSCAPGRCGPVVNPCAPVTSR